jgi:polar amino acid transport system ATP-binding protein
MANKHRHSREDVPVVPDALSAEEAASLAFASDKTLTKHRFTEGEHPIVRIEHLNKSFDETKVLRDVNLDVWPGEVVVVLGPSGSGKSTMLRCINLLETPTAGHILIEDQEITGQSKTDVNKLRREVGMVFQSFNLFPHLTAKQNVMIGQTKVLKRSKEEAEAEKLVSLGDMVTFTGPGGPRGLQAAPALRWPAAARGHRARRGYASQRAAFR